MVRGLAAGLAAIALMGGLLGGLAGELGAGPVRELMVGLGFGLLFGLMASLGAGLRIGLRNQDWLTDEPAYANLQLKHRTGMLVRDLVVGLGVGLGAALAIGALFALVAGLRALLPGGLSVGLVGGLMFGLVFALGKWLGTPSRTGWASTPDSTYKETRALTVIQISVGGLAGGLGVGLLLVSTGGSGGVLVGMLVAGLGVGLVGGLGLMSSGAWFSYIVTSSRLAAAGKLPLRLMDFLDDAHRLGLLRMTGSAYQFRHAEFHDHLIRTGGSRTETE
jgi:hypothetical protein